MPIPAPELATVKVTPATSTFYGAGDRIAYQATVTNVTTGDIEFQMDDCQNDDGSKDQSVHSVAAGKELTVTCTQAATSDDVADKTMEITGLLYAWPAGHASEFDEVDTLEVLALAAPTLDLYVHADPQVFTAADETITVIVEVGNDGNVPLSSIVVNDERVGLVDFEVEDLGPGGNTRFTLEITTTAADVSARGIIGVSVANATDERGGVVSSGDAGAWRVDLAVPELTVAWAQSADHYTRAGETVTYTAVVTNTGNVAVEGIEARDALVGAQEIEALAPGAEAVLEFPYTVTEADIAGGEPLENGLVVTGTAVRGQLEPVGVDALEARYAEISTDTMKVSLTADGAQFDGVDASVGFAAVVENGSDVSVVLTSMFDRLGAVELATAADGPAEPLSAGDGGVATSKAHAGTVVAPGEAVRVTGTYVTTEADAAAGGVANALTASLAPVAHPDSTYTFTSAEVSVAAKPAPAPAPVPAGGGAIRNTGLDSTLMAAAAAMILVGGVLVGRGRSRRR